jgi:hypothetical protein
MNKQFLILGFAAIAIVYGILYSVVSPIRASDPDQYYHYSVAKHFSQTQDIHTLPQVKGLGWDKDFANKEFLFHVVISAAYKMGGEPGIHWVIFFFSLATLLLIYAMAYFLIKDVAISIAAGLFPLLADSFVLRLVVVRPHVMGMALAFLLVLGLLKNWRTLVFITGVLFTLSYHAMYLPIFILALWGLTQKFYRRQDQLVWLGLAGMLVGSLINPYFPSNYIYNLTFFKIIAAQ